MHALSVVGVIGAVALGLTLLIGRRQEPGKKVSGTIACVLALAVFAAQAVFGTIGWLGK
jgi:hypothetical protein